MKSKILMDEVVENTDRKFGSAKKYYPIMVHDLSGYANPAMFTEDEIVKAMERAKKNTEDFPDDDSWFNIF